MQAIYATASPFRMSENSFWANFFKKIRPGWSPPNRYALSHNLLDTVYNQVNKFIQDLISQSETFVLMTDGWSCISNDSHIQIMLATPTPIYIRSIHPKENSHTGQYIFNQIVEIIEDKNIISNKRKIKAFCTDNAANMVADWKLIENKYDWTSAYGCFSHGLNLLACDLANKNKIISETLKQNKQLVKFFKSKHSLKSIVERCSLHSLNKSFILILPVVTRCSS
nr:uncharacterized protein LOC124814290 [Hydra vulgaris]